jgi:arylsulfatase A-like enzyme
VVIALGDNGTPEQAVLAPRDPAESKLSMYEGGLNVPFLVAGAGVAHGESQALVSVVDVLPTLAELAGVEPVDEDGAPIALDGRSLWPELTDPAGAPGPDHVYAEDFAPLGFGPYEHSSRAVRDGRWKYVASDDTREEHLLDLQGRVDDGPDLLATPPLDDEAQEALARLRGVMAGYERTLVPDP